MLRYSLLVGSMKKIVCLVLKHNNYDSVNNFILFHDKYIKSGLALEDSYRTYDPPIRSKQHTCVGLGLELMRRMKSLEVNFKGLSKSTSLLSCEEAVNINVEEYIKMSRGRHHQPPITAEKEHVLVGVQICIGKRVGLMIADPGYHVGTVVTIMNDGRPPHTGPFKRCDMDGKIKEYNYFVNRINKSFLEWYECQTKDGVEKRMVSLIFKSQPYLTAVEVTEKRNIIFNYKSHIKRDCNGYLVAGYYFGLNTNFEAASVTVLVGTSKVKFMLKDFSDPLNIPQCALDELNDVASFMNYFVRHVVGIMCKLAKIMAKTLFMEEILRLNDEVIRSLKMYNDAE